MGVAWAYVGATPPPAFAGGNDWWHIHKKACFEANPTTFPPKDLAEAEEITDEGCRARGGVPTALGPGAWLLHLWLPPMDYRLDLFASGHNCLGPERVAPQTDPCWAIARRDPALDPPPTSGPTTEATATEVTGSRSQGPHPRLRRRPFRPATSGRPPPDSLTEEPVESTA
jgi:hypothetical protein